MLVRKVMMLLDVGPKLINECFPALFVGHILKRCTTRMIRVCTKWLNSRLPSQVQLYRIPDPFSHCDGEVAEFPVVAGKGFQFVPEARGYTLGQLPLLVGKDVVKDCVAIKF